jgi:hypothetical protein
MNDLISLMLQLPDARRRLRQGFLSGARLFGESHELFENPDGTSENKISSGTQDPFRVETFGPAKSHGASD